MRIKEKTPKDDKPKEKKDNIFEYLIKNKIPFAVVKNYIFLKNEGVDLHANDFFVVIDKEDKQNISGFTFSCATTNAHKRTVEHTMSEYEIVVFKDMTTNDDFCCVLSNDFGRVYEYKKLSFKKHIDEKYPKPTKKRGEYGYVDEMKYKHIVGADSKTININVNELLLQQQEKVVEICKNCIFLRERDMHCFQKSKRTELTDTCGKGRFRKPKN